MGRYTGPRTKISRRFGEPLFGPDKVLDRRTNPPGQVIGLREKSKGLMAVQDSLNKHRVTVTWLEWNPASLTGSLTAVPERSEIPENLNMQAIVELYSR